MVNVDFSPALLLGVSMILGGLLLYNVRVSKAYLSRDYDVVISSIAVLTGGILVFQGWRLDPLLLFGQLLTAGTATAFALEVFRLRETIASRQVNAEDGGLVQGEDQQPGGDQRWAASLRRWSNPTSAPTSLPAPDADRQTALWQDSRQQRDINVGDYEQPQGGVEDNRYPYESYPENERYGSPPSNSYIQQPEEYKQDRDNGRSAPPAAEQQEDYRSWNRQVDFDSVEDW